MKLCWQKEVPVKIMGVWSINYGWDESFKTGVVKNSISVAVSFRGYWAGVSR